MKFKTFYMNESVDFDCKKKCHSSLVDDDDLKTTMEKSYDESYDLVSKYILSDNNSLISKDTPHITWSDKYGLNTYRFPLVSSSQTKNITSDNIRTHQPSYDNSGDDLRVGDLVTLHNNKYGKFIIMDIGDDNIQVSKKIPDSTIMKYKVAGNKIGLFNMCTKCWEDEEEIKHNSTNNKLQTSLFDEIF